MLELTSGAVNAVWDTPAGFRHGPKSLINDKTVTIHLLSPLSFTRQYDDDFLLEIQKQKKGNKIIAISPSFDGIHGSDAEIAYTNLGNGEVAAYIKGLLAVQLLAFEKSLALGITTDNPCAGGEVNRVVRGIRIHPLVV
jgi:tagatose-6-phosphate ketose/aldose isomerase